MTKEWRDTTNADPQGLVARSVSSTSPPDPRDVESLHAALAEVEHATIERCAKVAVRFARMFENGPLTDGERACQRSAEDIAEAIRDLLPRRLGGKS